MKKITALLMVAFLFACSKDEQVIDTQEEQLKKDFITRVNQGEFDNSKLGLYKGVFTTNDASVRATVRIENNGKDVPVAILTTPDGNSYELTASQKTSKGKASDVITFASSEASFDFSVDEKGQNITVDNVMFNGKESDILLAKQTSKAPLETVTGIYTCVDCPPTHPELGKDDNIQTFNMVFSGTGENATAQVQATLNDDVYGPGEMTQTNCTEEGDFTTCTLAGSLEDNDPATGENLVLFGGSGPVYATGIHTYNNQTTGTEDCSSVSGTATYESHKYGTFELAFQSDEPTNCEVPGYESIVYEDFEDTENVSYSLTSENGTPVTDDISGLGQNDYYGILINEYAPNVTYTDVLGSGYFGAQHTNAATNPVNMLRLTYEDVDISGMTILEFSIFFATYEDGPEGDFDQDARAGVEYSFDDGATWNKVIALEAGPGDPDADIYTDFLYEDVNFDGIGDVAGVQITETFTQLSRQIDIEGNNSVDIRVYVSELNNDQEDIAIDNFLVTGK